MNDDIGLRAALGLTTVYRNSMMLQFSLPKLRNMPRVSWPLITDTISRLDGGDIRKYLEYFPRGLERHSFPDLTHLSVDISRSTGDQASVQSERTFWDHFLAPTLKELQIRRLVEHIPSNQGFFPLSLELFTSQLVGLEALHVNGRERIQDLAHLVQHLPRLTTFSAFLVGDHSPQDLLDILEALRVSGRDFQYLEFFIGHREPEARDGYGPDWFDEFMEHQYQRAVSVKKLKLEWIFSPFNRALLNMIVTQRLESLDVVVPANPLITLLNIGLPDLVRCTNLKTLRLDIFCEDLESYTLSETLLLDLACSCHNLETIFIRDPMKLLRTDTITRQVLSVVARQAPRLRNLHIESHPRYSFWPSADIDMTLFRELDGSSADLAIPITESD